MTLLLPADTATQCWLNGTPALRQFVHVFQLSMSPARALLSHVYWHIKLCQPGAELPPLRPDLAAVTRLWPLAWEGACCRR